MSTPGHDQADVVTGLMLQITEHAERLALLDQRETAHYGGLTQRWDDLARQLTEVVERVDAVHDLAARQAALLETLDGLDQQIATLTTRLNQMTAATKPDEGGIRQPV
jgi:ABC-type transporter Mla subunit MlaD